MTRADILDFYVQGAPMTATARNGEFDALPRDVAGLAAVAQGLILHEHLADHYGVALTEAQRAEVHIRSTDERLSRLLAQDARPLTVSRAPAERLIGNCRHFSVLLVAALRHYGVPARARCGFGSYFEAGQYVDHWVCEYWSAPENRWVRADAQIDALQRSLFSIDFDLLDVPHDRFLIAGDAWSQCRAASADPNAFGIMDMRGLWFIAGNVVRDFAALNNMEMLPWDAWGGMLQPGEKLSGERLAFFDALAGVTQEPDGNFDALRSQYGSDDRVRVPAAVFNAVLGREEPVQGYAPEPGAG